MIVFNIAPTRNLIWFLVILSRRIGLRRLLHREPMGLGAETAGRLSYQNKRREASLERGSADNSIRMCGCACVCVCVSQTCMYIHIYIYGDNIHVSWSD